MPSEITPEEADGFPCPITDGLHLGPPLSTGLLPYQMLLACLDLELHFQLLRVLLSASKRRTISASVPVFSTRHISDLEEFLYQDRLNTDLGRI